MDPTMLMQVMPFLKSILGMFGGGGPMAPAPSTALVTPGMGMPALPQQMGLPAMGLGALASGQPATPPAATGTMTDPAHLNSYANVMKSLEGLGADKEGSPRWAPAFHYNPAPSRGHQLRPSASPTSVGSLFTSPAGQELLRNLRTMALSPDSGVGG